MFVSHQQQTGEKHALPPAQLHSLRIRSSIGKLIFHLCAFVLPSQTWSIREKLTPSCICLSSNLIMSASQVTCQNYNREGESSEHGQNPFPSLRRRMVPVQWCRM